MYLQSFHFFSATYPAKGRLLVACFFILAYQMASAQAKWHTTGGTVKITGQASLVLQDADLINDGQFSATDGTVSLSGTSDNTIGGAGTTQLDHLRIDKSGAAKVQLSSNVFANRQIVFVQGLLDLNGHNLTLSSEGALIDETEQHRVIGPSGGKLVITQDLNAPNGDDPGNLGLTITSAANLGLTTIRRGHQPRSLTGAGTGIERYYEVEPTFNTGLNATVSFRYFDAELNGVPEPNLNLWAGNAGNWSYQGTDQLNTQSNEVVLSGLPELPDWTLGPGQPDSDGDQVPDNIDNCPGTANPGQEDSNNNGIGDACECSGVDIILNAQIITQDTQYRAEEMILSTETLTSGTTITYQAGTSVTLQPGFHAQPGTVFSAVIAPCAIPPAGNLLSQNQDQGSETTHSEEGIEAQQLPLGEQPKMRVFPNPFRYQAQLEVALPDSGQADVTIVDLSGKTVHQLLQGEYDAGFHRLTWTPEDIPGGVYFVRLVFEGQVNMQKVVLIR